MVKPRAGSPEEVGLVQGRPGLPQEGHPRTVPPSAPPARAAGNQDLSAGVKHLINVLNDMEARLFDQRVSFQSVVEEWAAKLEAHGTGAIAMQIATLRASLDGATEAEARNWAAGALLPGMPGDYTGVKPTGILHWSLKVPSFWKGVPDNPRVGRIARSILASGFRLDSVIASRTLPSSTEDEQGGGIPLFSLKFGDGSCRGLAAALCLMLLLETPGVPAGDEGLKLVLESVMHVPTSFERHGDGS